MHTHPLSSLFPSICTYSLTRCAHGSEESKMEKRRKKGREGVIGERRGKRGEEREVREVEDREEVIAATSARLHVWPVTLQYQRVEAL